VPANRAAGASAGARAGASAGAEVPVQMLTHAQIGNASRP
jgi:hypothetical protein